MKLKTELITILIVLMLVIIIINDITDLIKIGIMTIAYFSTQIILIMQQE